MPLPLNQKIPVKHYTFQLRFKLENGDFQEVQMTAANRGIMQGIVDNLTQFITPTAGQGVVSIEIDVGNGLDKSAK